MLEFLGVNQSAEVLHSAETEKGLTAHATGPIVPELSPAPVHCFC